MAPEISILDGLPDPIFFVDARGRLVYLNQASEGIFGGGREEVRSRGLGEVLGSELDEGLAALLSPPPQDLTPASLAGVRLGAGFWDVRVVPGAGGVVAVHCTPAAGDRAGWPELVADSADAIWATDAEGRIVAWNRGAEEMFGYTSAEILGEPVTRLIPGDLIEEREPERLQKALQELGSVRDYQTRRVRKDGREVEVSLTSTVVRNGAAQALACSTIVRDLSQRRQLERQVIESEKLATLGQLAASVAQEIGAPLTTIGIVLEKLRKQSGLENGEVRKQLDTATQQLSRIARLTHGLVELAKPGELHLEAVQVREVIDRVLELVGASLRRAAVEVRVESEGELPRILADAGQLQQVFLNLLLNAQRALEGTGGLVTIRSALVRGFPVTGRPVRRVVRIELSDDGPGIDPADVPYIFAPFFSRSGGSGLGLALAKQIVHAHGGSIDVRSSPGNGATFTILIPVESDE